MSMDGGQCSIQKSVVHDQNAADPLLSVPKSGSLVNHSSPERVAGATQSSHLHMVAD